MRITFIAQAGVIVELDSHLRFCIDLWLNNPLNPLSMDDVPTMDYVFITHDHPDHDMKSGVEIAKRDDAIFVSSPEISEYAREHGVNKVDGGYCGGAVQVGDLTVIRAIAHHNSSTGIPLGFIIETPRGTLYHMGDTAYFHELKLYGEMYKIDVLFIPIGSRFTMDARQAAYAVADIKPKVAIPIHYNTFPLIQQDPNRLIEYVNELNVDTEIRILEVGNKLNLDP